MRVRIEEVRATLATEGVAAAGQLQQLLRTVTEALADLRAARVVPAPEGRDLSAAFPGATDTGAAYEVTETERAKATNLLTNLLFTVVETPTHEDRRRADREGDALDGDDEGNPGDDDVPDDARDTAPDDAHDTAPDDARDNDDTDAEESTDFGVTGYAGPE
ncbi:hypothetical protein DC522_33885, partial [Microvirga sp. KLBC 81]|uniref:hypothetical protein n=1 Tax=Microvirga sp. KLBC 81 TaxID=1862707 RepID=UPI000D50CB6F